MDRLTLTSRGAFAPTVSGLAAVRAAFESGARLSERGAAEILGADPTTAAGLRAGASALWTVAGESAPIVGDPSEVRAEIRRRRLAALPLLSRPEVLAASARLPVAEVRRILAAGAEDLTAVYVGRGTERRADGATAVRPSARRVASNRRALRSV